MRCPLNYSLCNQTVTLYRNDGTGIVRQVVENAFYTCKAARRTAQYGDVQADSFFMVVPGEEQRVRVGDRVFPGVGPEISAMQWDNFIPAAVTGLVIVKSVCPMYWNGAVCHTECTG